MKKLLQGILAGYGANKISQKNGCGCIGTIIIFIILFSILGYVFNWFGF